MRSFASWGRLRVYRDLRRGFGTRATYADERQAFQALASQHPSAVSAPFGETKSSDLVRVALQLAYSPPQEALEKAWESFEDKALESCSLLRGEEIVQVLYACTVARRRPKRLLTRLAGEIPDKLAQFDINGVCVCLHAYAQLREREKRLFSAAVRKLVASEIHTQVTLGHLASLLYSHARALLSDKSLNEVVQIRLAEEANVLSVTDLATTLQAFLTFRLQDDSALIACSRVAVVHARNGEDLEQLCASVYVLTRMNVKCDDFVHAVAKQCEIRKSTELEKLPVSCLVQLLYSLGDSGWATVARNAVTNSFGKCLHDLIGPKMLVQALEAFARALHSGPPLQEVCTRVATYMVDFSVKDLIATAVACRQLGHACDEVVWEALARQAVRKGWRFKSKHAQIILESCALVGFDHPAIEELRASVQAREAETQLREVTSTDSRDRDQQYQEQAVGEDDVFFQEQRLEKHEIDSVASAAKAWARGRKARSKQGSARDQDEETDDLKSRTFAGARGTQWNWRHAQAASDMRDGPTEPTLGRQTRKRDADPELHEALRDYDRDVLRPSGLESEALSTRRNRRGRTRPS